MLFAEFHGNDKFNKHFTKLSLALEYIQSIIELEFFNLTEIHLYELSEENDTVFMMQILWIDVPLIRKAKKDKEQGCG